MNAFIELIRGLPSGVQFIVLIVGICTGVGFLTTVVCQLRLLADHEADRRFKRDLVDSGLSVEETERVAAAPVAKRDEAD